jgi:hypothetical protein
MSAPAAVRVEATCRYCGNGIAYNVLVGWPHAWVQVVEGTVAAGAVACPSERGEVEGHWPAVTS